MLKMRRILTNKISVEIEKVDLISPEFNMILQSKILFVVLLFLTACSADTTSAEKPERLRNIPDSAFWCGGIDGGNWYYVHSIHPHRNNAVISVYNDQDGSLIMKKRFLLICNLQKPTSIYDLKNQISSFDGEKIYFKQTDSVECWLQPQR